jgi:hypothetical protein
VIIGGGAPTVSRVEGGGAPGGGSACESAAAGRPGQEDDPTGRAGWAGQRPRLSGSLGAATQKEGRESGPAGVEGEAVRGWAESGAGPEFKRNSFRISIDF